MPDCPSHTQLRTDMIDGVVYCKGCNEPLPKLYPNRNSWHKNMGPPEYYIDCCGGTGISYKDEREVYCQCEAGRLKKELER